VAVKPVLLLGNPKLYEISDPVYQAELQNMHGIVSDLCDTLMDFRKRNGVGRAIAAPQIGVMKRVIYMNVNNRSTVFINPELKVMSNEMIEVWDDCLCFPDLLVRVMRHNSCRIYFINLDWKEESMELEGDLSELLQHEYDHLEGILAISRAIDGKSFAFRSERDLLKVP
jgi:peptide deformylase